MRVYPNYDNVATVEYDYLRVLEAVHQELEDNYPALLERIYDKLDLE
tara:strand:- start:227 stop:367 length:141 start_codon:yes stop_codon:yes gene_type:complete